MEAVHAALAAAVVLVHFGFVAFAALGGLLTPRWAWMPWMHLPAAAWAAYIELSGRICPLTPLENTLRRRAGLDAYSGDFVARYLFPVLYPDGLTRDVQIALGSLLIAGNAGLYLWLWQRQGRRSGSGHRA